MARTYRHQPSEVRKALIQRNGGGHHGGSAKAKHRRDRKAQRQALKRGDWR